MASNLQTQSLPFDFDNLTINKLDNTALKLLARDAVNMV
jgi:hypothetical protein